LVPSDTKARRAVSVLVSTVCVAIALRPGVFEMLSSQLDDLCSILLGRYGLPGPLGSIVAGVSLICRFVKSASSSLVSVC
jgi:hypothetical protein